MPLFSAFNNQGWSNQDAFEELCCQLFRTWGTVEFDDGWSYRNIRGAGGDGGVEAYWREKASDKYVGIQAKWFPGSLDDSRIKQIKKSLETAVALRPSLICCIVCIPHNLTSKRRTGRGGVTGGEDSLWSAFCTEMQTSHPALEIELWDESMLLSLLQMPANEGVRRFWFSQSAINPDTIALAINKTLARMSSRYTPALNDEGGLSDFLDRFFGTRESRAAILQEIDALSACYGEIKTLAESVLGLGQKAGDGTLASAEKCLDVLDLAVDELSELREFASTDTGNLKSAGPIKYCYAELDDFRNAVADLERSSAFHSHGASVRTAIEKLEELPGLWILANELNEAFSEPHCVVIGHQGTGKTCGLAHKAQSYLTNGIHIPLLLRAADVPDGADWFEILSQLIDLDGAWDAASLFQALSASAALLDIRDGNVEVAAKVAIFVDGLDERPPASFWAQLIREADTITRSYPRIRFCFSSRPNGVAFREDNHDLLSCSYHISDDGDVPVSELFNRYVEHYRIGIETPERYKWTLRTPMELRLFCNAYQGKTIASEKPVSTFLTDLLNAEIDRLEEEYSNHRELDGAAINHPVRTALEAVSSTLISNEELSRAGLIRALKKTGLNDMDASRLINFLLQYGFLIGREESTASRFGAAAATYSLGSTHLYDFSIACMLMDESQPEAERVLSERENIASYYAILLIEERGHLPIDDQTFVAAVGIEDARYYTIDALARSRVQSVEPHKNWVLDELTHGGIRLREVVNGLIYPVSCIVDHPLGPKLLDTFLRSFSTPAERDILWSVPVEYDSPVLARYKLRDQLQHMPELRLEDRAEQAPILFAWLLSSVDNLKRCYCRGQLLCWAFANGEEFASLFKRFASCNDPQVREDIFAIAEEAVCQAALPFEAEQNIALTVIESVFAEPNRPSNRNAAVRHYGRLLIEHAIERGAVEDSYVAHRPPYPFTEDSGELSIYKPASDAKRMSGYKQEITYDLARYVLVYHLEGALGIDMYGEPSNIHDSGLEELLLSYRNKLDLSSLEFEGWAIAAAYQYILDQGYQHDTFWTHVAKDGVSIEGTDSKIVGSYYAADHGSKSTVMTVAEKYVWCARNEICGYLADRIRVSPNNSSEGSLRCNSEGYLTDYSNILDFDSPLLELSVAKSMKATEGITPVFPMPFKCEEGAPYDAAGLDEWIDSLTVEAAIQLLLWQPNVPCSIHDHTIPIWLYASDRAIAGASTRSWVYCGLVGSSDLENLASANNIYLQGFGGISSLVAGVDNSGGATYMSPVEVLASPWIEEIENHGLELVADNAFHLDIKSLVAECVANLNDVGDFYCRYPTKVLRDMCGVTYNDGLVYQSDERKTLFEQVNFGTSFVQEYQGLLADKTMLFETLESRGLAPVWLIHIWRGESFLAGERLPEHHHESDLTWLIWMNNEETICHLPIVDERK